MSEAGKDGPQKPQIPRPDITNPTAFNGWLDTWVTSDTYDRGLDDFRNGQGEGYTLEEKIAKTKEGLTKAGNECVEMVRRRPERFSIDALAEGIRISRQMIWDAQGKK